VTKNVGQTNDVTIYGRPMSKHSMNSVIREFSIHITNFSSLIVKQRGVITQTFLVGQSLHITITITGKLSRTFRLVHLIIPFDRGRK